MFRRFSTNYAVFSIFLDVLLVTGALFLAALLRAPLNILAFVEDIPPVNLPWVIYLVFPTLWIGVLILFSVYDGRKNLRVVDELASLTLGAILATVSLAGILYLSYRDISRFMFLMANCSAYGLLVGWRLAARWGFRKRRLNFQVRRVLILGASDTGRRLETHILGMPEFGLEVIGFLDDHLIDRKANDILGSLSRIRFVVQEKRIDDVVVALPLEDHEELARVINQLQDLPVKIWVIPDYFSLTLYRAQVENFANMPMLDLRAPALSEYQLMIKRTFDLVLTFLLLPFSLPVMSIIALAIKFDSPGPVFYRALRVGENGRTFSMLKFRTMVQDADRMLQNIGRYDENHNYIHKLPQDPRVTRVGRVLRKTSLDELPQLINILRGEMSLVGPRPEMPELVERYDSWQRKRFAVPQGMTGWWQVNGRSDKPMHLHVEEDLYYIQNYSPWLDLQILIRTIWVVIWQKGAF
jgi:exopolysaccharide biosynthesis polyprenyl glycosylphosphotransferase